MSMNLVDAFGVEPNFSALQADAMTALAQRPYILVWDGELESPTLTWKDSMIANFTNPTYFKFNGADPN